MKIPLTIGKKAEADFHHPLALLSECHRRIEHFFHIFVAISKEAHGAPLTEAQGNALRAALRYFRQAAPLHTRDEEESLFPRMRASSKQEVLEQLAVLDHLNSDHRTLSLGHDNVDLWMNQWLEHQELPGGNLAQLTDVLGEMDAIYGKHIALEDGEIFPLAGRVLDVLDLESVGREMAARRGLEFTPADR